MTTQQKATDNYIKFLGLCGKQPDDIVQRAEATLRDVDLTHFAFDFFTQIAKATTNSARRKILVKLLENLRAKGHSEKDLDPQIQKRVLKVLNMN